MTRAALALLVACALPSAASAARSADVVPERYALTLSPSLQRHGFSGAETIDVRLGAPTRTITLDAIGLVVADARVRSGGTTVAAKVGAGPTYGTITLELPEAVAGEVQLALSFRGKLGDDLGGLYEADDGGRPALFTHFEPSGARRVFPCFDDPAKKARFTVTVDVDAGEEAISNTAVVERVPIEGGRRARVRFAETEPLPTYLVALAVGHFGALHASAGATPLGAVAAPDRLPLARFALDTAAALLPRFAAYFGRDYPFPKLDLVAVPAFAAGGMENAGAIFLRADRMLVDPARASPATLHAVAMVVAHELAHQWLGDLVTPSTWKELWLAEATATYVAHEVVAAWQPAWRPWDALQPAIDEVMADDELAAAHPVRATDGGHALFDAITYNKGAALLRMLAGWIGDDVLRDAFRALVRDHAFAAVGEDEFLAALDATTPTALSQAVRPWLEERGHPTIRVAASCEGDVASVTLTRQHAQPAWAVPLQLRWPGGQRLVLLDGATTTTELDGCPAWIDANAGRLGFYRVRYDAPWAAALADAAERALDPAERAGLVSDAWLEVRDGGPFADFLALALRLRGERSPVVLDELGRRLAFAADWIHPSERSAFERLVDDLFAPTLAALGWRARAGEDEDATLARGRVVELLGGLARAPDVLAEAERRLRRYLADARSADGALADALVLLGAQRGDSDRYDAYLLRLHAARTPEEQERFQEALTRFQRPALLRRTLTLLLTALVPAEALTRISTELADNARGRATAWRFWKSHFDALERKAPRAGWLLPATQRFCDAGVAREIGHFFTTREPYPSLAGAVAETAERVASCASVRDRAGTQLAAWLHARYAEARSAAPHAGAAR